MKELGYNKGYRYAHNSPEAYLPQEYLPDMLRDAQFYVPGSFEKKIAERMEWWASLKSGEKQREREGDNVSGEGTE
jgi:putative ATPase